MLELLLVLACSKNGGDSAGEADADTDADSDTDTDSDTDLGPDADKDGYDAAIDCDDTDPAINPGAKETCGNGADDNCNGTSDGCDWSGTSELDGYVLHNDFLNTSAAQEIAVCDVNGDGQLDVLLGAPGAMLDVFASGGVYVFFGPVVADHTTEEADWILEGTDSLAWAGWAVECAGDVDGDGVADVVVGAPDEPSPGAAFLVPGGGSGSVPIADAAIGHWTGAYSGDQLGGDAAVLDSNGDGLTDFAVSAWYGTNDEVTEDGATYLWLGPASGTGTAEAAPTQIYGEKGTGLYYSTASAGDLDGDGAEELIITGAPDDVSYTGTLFVFEGPLSGVMAQSDADLRIGDGSGSSFGVSSAGIVHGDLDGDGGEDLIASDPHGGTATGVVYAFLGGITADLTTAAADATIFGSATYQSFGYSLATPGDIDGDGNADLVVGAPGADKVAKNGGLVALFYGPFAGILDLESDAQAQWRLSDDQATAGTDLASGDVTGDGVVDVVVGAPFAGGGAAVILSPWNL